VRAAPRTARSRFPFLVPSSRGDAHLTALCPRMTYLECRLPLLRYCFKEGSPMSREPLGAQLSSLRRPAREIRALVLRMSKAQRASRSARACCLLTTSMHGQGISLRLSSRPPDRSRVGRSARQPAVCRERRPPDPRKDRHGAPCQRFRHPRLLASVAASPKGEREARVSDSFVRDRQTEQKVPQVPDAGDWMLGGSCAGAAAPSGSRRWLRSQGLWSPFSSERPTATRSRRESTQQSAFTSTPAIYETIVVLMR
jgi:hypothetical protein